MAKLEPEDVKDFLQAKKWQEYELAKKQVMDRFEKRREQIEALEKEHVINELDVGIVDFFEVCDRYKTALNALDEDFDDDEEDCYEENEKEFEDAEFFLQEASVPNTVWKALFSTASKKRPSTASTSGKKRSKKIPGFKPTFKYNKQHFAKLFDDIQTAAPAAKVIRISGIKFWNPTDGDDDEMTVWMRKANKDLPEGGYRAWTPVMTPLPTDRDAIETAVWKAIVAVMYNKDIPEDECPGLSWTQKDITVKLRDPEVRVME
jgi:hypothetical protein